MRKFLPPFALTCLVAGCALPSDPEGGSDVGSTHDPNVFGTDDRQDVPTTGQWRALGALFTSTGGRCSATLIGPDLIVTAAHCVSDSSTGELRSRSYTFHPMYRDGSSPDSSAIAEVWSGWSRGNVERGDDWAVLRLAASLGDEYGWLPVRRTTASTFPSELTVAGYSSGWKNGQTGSVHHDCATRGRDSSRRWILHDCDAARGSSGGPALRNYAGQLTIVGINVAERRNGGDTSLRVAEYDDRYANIAIPTNGLVDWLEARFPDEAPACTTIGFEGGVSAFGGDQDSSSAQWEATENGNALRIALNAWKQVDLDYTLTANTVIEFDFRSGEQGEIHGIGFETDNAISSDRTFQLYGTQEWGIRAFSYDGSGEWRHFRIPVGEYYRGHADRVVFVADNDDDQTVGESAFRSLRMHEGPGCDTPRCGEPLVFDSSSFVGYQDQDFGTASASGRYLRVSSNAWKALAQTMELAPDSVLSFEFRSSAEGEIHAIAFGDSVARTTHGFQVFGTQSWGHGSGTFNDYAGDNEWRRYDLPIGEYVTGTFDRLVFIADNDADPNVGVSEFRSVRLSRGVCTNE